MVSPMSSTFVPDSYILFMQHNYQVPVTCIAVYLSFCYFGKAYMHDKKPLDLKYPLVFWNTFLALFSFVGAAITVPTLISNLANTSFKETVCSNALRSWGSGQTGLWVLLFALSKIPELFDTVFIVLRKKPLIFLHWYHHATVLMYCWSATSVMAPTGLWFVAMNYSVHAVMYSYYALQAMKMCPKSFPSYLITVGQISQMVVGTAVCMSSWYFTNQDPQCEGDVVNRVMGALMYSSYLVLFVNFALNRFVFSKKAKRSEKKE